MKVLFSSKPRSTHFFGYLRGWRRYTTFIKTEYHPALRKWFFYLFVPQLKRQFCLDVWL